jgi:acetyltransferase-like isoleucine patch superfamily enzyme
MRHFEFPLPGTERILAAAFGLLLFRRNFYHFGRGAFVSPYARLQNMGKISLGNGSAINRGTQLLAYVRYGAEHFDPLIEIGDFASVGSHCTISCCNRVSIGANVTIGDRVYIADAEHEYRNPDCGIREQPMRVGTVRIGRNAWIDDGSFISRDVEIGEHSVVGANSVVLRCVPPYSVAAGVPARIVRRYDRVLEDWVRVAE